MLRHFKVCIADVSSYKSKMWWTIDHRMCEYLLKHGGSLKDKQMQCIENVQLMLLMISSSLAWEIDVFP